MNVYLHQTHQTIGDFDSIFKDLQKRLGTKGPGNLHVFPELFLTGYPLQDLCLQRSFIERYQHFFKELTSWPENCKNDFGHALVGGLRYTFVDGMPEKIENCVWLLTPGKAPEHVYTKRLLPNYDIYDEEKYFFAGSDSCVLELEGKKIGILICEDMWMSSFHRVDPVKDLLDHCESKKLSLDLVVNLSASPFHLNKHPSRLERAGEISRLAGAPFVYVNRVGGEDEILFDGRSFAIDKGRLIVQAPIFEEGSASFDLEKFPAGPPEAVPQNLKNTWEDLFSPNIGSGKPPLLTQLTDNDCTILMEALGFGIVEYARKSGFKKLLVALSGGIDSALVLAIAHHMKPADWELEALYMPGQFNAGLSYDLSREMCDGLGIPLRTFSIKFLHSAVRNGFLDAFGENMEGLTDENIQSRLRGSLLYARSNATGAMVLNTSNKSELAVGYSTQYGDSVGAVSVLGDLYKSEVFQLSNYINRTLGPTIPEGIITRPPSAELREGQKDSDSLPPYEILDAILEGFLSYRFGPEGLKQRGFDDKDVEKVYRLYLKSEYKRNQFCPIIKVRAKSFGFGYRTPINKSMS